MKVISVWQPVAQMSVMGFKVNETRTWPAPRSIIGQRIGIASTKNISPEQRLFFTDEEFQGYYQRLGLPPVEELPRGYLLGSVVIEASELMTEELLEDTSDEEQAYGHWDLGNYAWRQVKPICFAKPIPVVGKQGIWDWDGEIPDDAQEVRPDQRPEVSEEGLRISQLQADEARPVQPAVDRWRPHLVVR